MPEINMCPSQDCPARGDCYRNEASGTRPNDRWQSWSAWTWQSVADGDHVLCDGFWSAGRTALASTKEPPMPADHTAPGSGEGEQQGATPDGVGLSQVERICHNEQMMIWTGEITGSLSMGGYLRDDLSYDDKLDLHAAIAKEVRDIVGSVLTHPALHEDRNSAMPLVVGHLAALRDDARAMEAAADLFRPEFEACWARDPDGRMGEMLRPERALQLRALVLTGREDARRNRALADAIEVLIAPCDGSGAAGETEGLAPQGDSAVPEGQAPDPSPTREELQAEVDRLQAALAENEGERAKVVHLLRVLSATFDSQGWMKAGDAGARIAAVKQARAYLASTPSQETPDVTG